MKNLYVSAMSGLFVVINLVSIQAQYVWTQKASLNALGGRATSAGFSIGHYGFIGCGQTAHNYTYDFWRWNQDSNTWTSIADYPGAGRLGMTSFSIGGKGYCCLGWTGNALATDLWAYDTSTNTWSQKANFPGAGRYQAFVFVIGTKAYVGCGDPDKSPYYQDVWVYDAVADTWAQVANFPGGDRNNLYAFSINGYGYAGGGNDSGNFFNDLWRYDTNSNTWTRMASLPIAGGQITGAACFVTDSLAFVGTGRDLSMRVYNNFWSYSATTNTWTAIASLPGVSRWCGVGFSIGNKGYIGTGDTGNIQTSGFFGGDLSDFWQYGPTNTSGIDNVKNSNVSINIYPNPSSGLVNFIYSDLSSANDNLIITDVLGRTISEYHILGQQGKLSIDEAMWNNGVYFYRIISPEGISAASGKFLIER